MTSEKTFAKGNDLTIEDLQEKIDVIYDDLTPAQQKAILYIRKKWEQICFMTAREVGLQANVSEATIQRIAVCIGFKSFRDMKMKMRASFLKKRAVVNFKLKDDSRADQLLWLNEHVSAEISNILQTFRSNSGYILKQAAELLFQAKRILVLGDKMGSGASAYLSFTINYLIGKTILLNLSNVDEYLSSLGENDVLVVIGFQRYSSRTLKVVELAKAKKASVLAFTDCHLSPFAKHADVVLFAATDSVVFLDSYSSVISLSHALISMMIHLDPQGIRHRIEDTEKIYDVLNKKS